MTVPEHMLAQDDATEVWDVNWAAVMLFVSLTTQWRVSTGMAGLVWFGLDYVAADVVLRRQRWKRKKADAAFADLRTMEAAALEALSDMRDDPR